MSTFRSDFFHLLVNQAYEDIFYQKSNYYFFLGKIDPWNDEDEPESDSFPRSVNYDRRIRDNILYLDRIRPTNASIVAKRYPWENFKVFDYWDHTQEMEGKPFHCVTSNNDVYKCLYNGSGVKSTVEPSIRSTKPFKTSDGYLWKYMYSIPKIKANKFLYGPYMPVQKALTDSFFNNGGIESVTVVSGGSGYQITNLTTIEVSDTTTGSGATASIDSLGANGNIQSLTVDSGGSGYTSGAAVKITSATGNGAVIEPIIDSGTITGFNIIEEGAGYESTDTADIVVGNASIIPVLSRDGSVIDTYVKDRGIGYSSNPTLSVEPTLEGTGIYGNSSAVLKAHVYNGSIVNITIEDPGKDYPVDTETSITVTGDGEGAKVLPVIDPDTGEIVSVSVESSGEGYTYASFGVSGNGTGAELRANISDSDIFTFQSAIEQTAVDGAIYSVTVTDEGTGYFEDASIIIEGDGTGAKAFPVVENGRIKEILMSDYGSGYTYANVIISDAARDDFANDDASAYAILPPIGGHGYNAVKELFGRTLLIYSILTYDSFLDLVQQDYRQFGILQGPRTSVGNRKINESSLLTDFELQFDSTESLNVDELLINDQIKYRVVKIDGNTVRLQQLSFPYDIPTNTFYKQNDASKVYQLLNLNSTPILNKYSGNLLYTTNRAFIDPFDDQSFNVRSYLEFKTDPN